MLGDSHIGGPGCDLLALEPAASRSRCCLRHTRDSGPTRYHGVDPGRFGGAIPALQTPLDHTTPRPVTAHDSYDEVSTEQIREPTAPNRSQ